MPAGQQGDRREGGVVDRFPLGPARGHDRRDLAGMPGPDGIGHAAQSTGFVHDLLVIAGRQCPLGGTAHPAGPRVAVFALMEWEGDRPSPRPLGQLAQKVLGVDDAPAGGTCLGQPVCWPAGGQARPEPRRWSRARLEGERHPEPGVPRLLPTREVSGLGAPRRHHAVGNHTVQAIQRLVCEVTEARHTINAPQVPQGQDALQQF
jgi:hypothetical protein